MKDLKEIIAEIKVICEEHPVMEDRLAALRHAGYDDIEYTYVKQNKIILPPTFQGLLATAELLRKKKYRIQVGNTELKRGYPAAWCLDISSNDVEYIVELPF